LGKREGLSWAMKVCSQRMIPSTKILKNIVDVEGIDLDLEGDWDPEKHDRQMRKLYEEREVPVFLSSISSLLNSLT
jgi:hypothetical protein